MTMADTDFDTAVAIVGMAGRFPGASSVEELWRNLSEGKSGLRPVGDQELAAAGVDPAESANPRYVRVAGPLDDIDMFDAGLFGFTPHEAETADPQHRLFLECAWEALEGAGYLPTNVPGQVGVFAGCGFPFYMPRQMERLGDEPGGWIQIAVGNERDSLSSTVSYQLDLRGPSIAVQSFCSTSLVAVHLASQSLLTFECDAALAGGSYIDLPQPVGYLYEDGGIMSPDGVVRSFDAGASGTVMGNGVGVVVLKRMADALADGDQIHAVILGSAMNNDGRARVGYTAPGVNGQSDVITTAMDVAGVDPRTVGYVECHATGTMLGDSIELAALSRAFPQGAGGRCTLGSLKPSLGHLDRAAGVAGLIRAALALRHRVLPGTPNYRTPNQALADADDRFRVLTSTTPWTSGGVPRRAGVNSFGLGGTNAHVVLQEAPEQERREPEAGPHLLVLSARSPQALNSATDALRQHLDLHPELDLSDVAFTLQQSRTGFPVRRAVVCRDRDDAIAALKDPRRWLDGEARHDGPPVSLGVPATAGLGAGRLAELCRAVPVAVGLPAGDVPPAGTEESLLAQASRAVVSAFEKLGVGVTAIDDDGAGQEVVDRIRAEVRPAGPRSRAQTVSVPMFPGDDESAREWFLAALSRLWLAGVRPDWSQLFRKPRRRVWLPTYPFQRRRYWIPEQPRKQRKSAPAGKIPDQSEWTYAENWRRQPAPMTELADRLRKAGPWLVFVADPVAEAMVRILEEANAQVTEVRPGDGFTLRGTGRAWVRPDSRRDHERLLAGLAASPRTVVHGLSLAESESPAGDGHDGFDRQQNWGFHSVRALVGALADRNDPHPVTLMVLTEGAVGITGSDLTRPACAPLTGLAPAISQENPAISCRHVDIDATAARNGSVIGRLAEQVLAESLRDALGPVAFRNHDRWVRGYDPIRLPSAAQDGATVPERATVLITGGLGDVGLVLARHLAFTRGCRLVLTTRSQLPPRDAWQDRLKASAGTDDRAARHIRSVLGLEADGAQVLAASADVADSDDMERVLRAAERRFGRPDVVIHGAGVSDPRFFGTAHELDRSACDAHFRSKVHGFLTLQELLGDHAGRRLLTLSSLSAVLGGITLGPYAAANSALDAYSVHARARTSAEWLTVDWDTWNVGDPQGDSAGGSIADFSMTPGEGIDIFERALSAAGEVGHVVISTGDLGTRLSQWLRGGQDDDAGAADEKDVGGRDPRPPLGNPYVEPKGQAEALVAEIWAEALGLERVGADDNFFELGGQSLVAMQLMGRIRRRLRATAPVTDLLENPTVRGLSSVLRIAE